MSGIHRNLSDPLKQIKEIEAIKMGLAPLGISNALIYPSPATQLTSGWVEDITL